MGHISDFYTLGFKSDEGGELQIMATFNRQCQLSDQAFLEIVQSTQKRLADASGREVLLLERQDADNFVSLDDDAQNSTGTNRKTIQQRAIYAIREQFFSDYSAEFEKITSQMDCFSQLAALLDRGDDWEEQWGISYREPYNSDYEANYLLSKMFGFYTSITSGIDREASNFIVSSVQGVDYQLRYIVGNLGDGEVKAYLIGGPGLGDAISEALESDSEKIVKEAESLDHGVYFYVDDLVFYAKESDLINYLRRTAR